MVSFSKAAVLVAFVALCGTGVHADFDPSRVSRRGLAIKGQYVTLMNGDESKCKELEAKLRARQEMARSAGKPDTDALNIGETCYFFFKGSESDAEWVRAQDNVVSCEEDQVIEKAADPASYGLNRIDQANLPLSRGQDFSISHKGNGANVYIVDTGILANHNDFGGRATFLADFSGEGAVDRDGHGTHCAGTAAGTQFGVASQANIFGIKVLGQNGGSTRSVVNGVNRAVSHARQQGRAGVISMSLGGGPNSAIDQAVRDAASVGMIVVVAAGNEAQNACNASPARAGLGVKGVITVGSTTITDTISSFSNFGDCVDIFAPGSAIPSAFIPNQNSVRTLSGTSMATPHVSGVAAALLEKHNFNAEDALDELFRIAVPNRVRNLDSRSPNLLLQAPQEVEQPPETQRPTTSPTKFPTASPDGGDGDGNVDLSEWTCPTRFFNTNDGCDCGCGQPMDPDCFKPETRQLFCRGRGARFFQRCLVSTNECVSVWSLLEDGNEAAPGSTPRPTFEETPEDKLGPGDEIEFINNPEIENENNVVNDDGGEEEGGSAAGVALAAVGGVMAVGGVAAFVVVRRRAMQRNSDASPKAGPNALAPAAAPTAGAVYPGGGQGYGQQQQMQGGYYPGAPMAQAANPRYAQGGFESQL